MTIELKAARGETVGCERPSGVCDLPFSKVLQVDGRPWVEVSVPSDATAGEYTAPGYKLTVYSFAIRTEPMPFYVGLDPGRVKRIEGRDAFSEYDAMLKAHGIDRPILPMPKYDRATGQIIDLGAHANLLPTRPLWLLPTPFGFDQWKLAEAYLHGYGTWLKSVGASNVAVYMVDEPNSKTEAGRKQQDQARLLGAFIAETKSPIMSMVPGSYSELNSVPVGLPVYHWGQSYSSYRRHWVYTGLRNDQEPTWLADQPDSSWLAPFFTTVATGAEGIWYWTAVLDKPYGDAFPGEGQWITKGPTPTRSLKIVREGTNCWKYLMMLKDRDLARRLATVVSTSFRVWERDASKIYAVKDLIAKHLEVQG